MFPSGPVRLICVLPLEMASMDLIVIFPLPYLHVGVDPVGEADGVGDGVAGPDRPGLPYEVVPAAGLGEPAISAPVTPLDSPHSLYQVPDDPVGQGLGLAFPGAGFEDFVAAHRNNLPKILDVNFPTTLRPALFAMVSGPRETALMSPRSRASLYKNDLTWLSP